MRRPGGTIIITDPDAPTVEIDTVTCCHCQALVPVKPKQDASDVGGFCRMCFKHTCGRCADLGTCTPFEKKLEQAEARGRSLRSMGL